MKRQSFGQKDGFLWIICEQRQFNVKNMEILRINFREMGRGRPKEFGENDGDKRDEKREKYSVTEWFM